VEGFWKATQLGVSRDTLRAMLVHLGGRDVSLDVKPFADSQASLLDGLTSGAIDQEASFAAGEIQGYVRDAVRVALADLDSRERYIVERRLMAGAGDELSLAELGRRLGVSRERARQLEKRAKSKLKGRISELSRGAGGEWLPGKAA
jgi:RNA polymerase sigma-32 factor